LRYCWADIKAIRIPDETFKKFLGLELASSVSLFWIGATLLEYQRFKATICLFSVACATLASSILISIFPIPSTAWRRISVLATYGCTIWLTVYLMGVVRQAQTDYYANKTTQDVNDAKEVGRAAAPIQPATARFDNPAPTSNNNDHARPVEPTPNRSVKPIPPAVVAKKSPYSEEKPTPKPQSGKPDKASLDARLEGDKPPTLGDLFNKDFPYTLKYKMEDSAIRFNDDGVTIPIKRQVYLDFPSKTRFVGFYVPMVNPSNDKDNFDACLKLSSLVDQTFSDFYANASVSAGFADQQESAKDLTFSGRVVLYHEDFLNITQKAKLIEAFKAKGYSVTFVGRDYLQLEIDQWRLHHKNN
jgi:hypothetical protein